MSRTLTALRTFHRLRQAGANKIITEAALTQLGVRFVVLDERERVVFLSDAAETYLRSSNVLTVRGSRLMAAGRQNSAELWRALRTAAAGHTATIALVDVHGVPYTSVTVVRPPPSTRDRLTYLRPHILLLIEGEKPRRADAVSALGALSGLTPGEPRVLAAILEGLSRSAAAERLGLSPNTVHTHIKRILAKTGKRSQRSLMALMLRGGFTTAK